jgi:predicted RND superfamily exporter protein
MFFRQLADRFTRHRGGLAAALVLITAASLLGVARLEYDDLPRTLFRSDDADFALLEETSQQFGADDVDCVLLVESDDLFRPADVLALESLVAATKRVPGIGRVESLAAIRAFPQRHVPRFFSALSQAVPTESYSLLPQRDDSGNPPSREACDAARTAALAHPLVRGQLLSDDAQSTLVVAHLTLDNPRIEQIAPIVADLRRVIDEQAEGSPLRVRLTGMAPIRAEIFQSVRSESAKFVWFGGSLAVLMATFMFRRPTAVFIVCFASMLGAAWTVGMMGLVGEKMNVITTILPTLVLVIGFTDAVHLMIDIRRERAAGVPPLKASADALRHLGLACLLCSLTTAVGFGSLATARIEVIRRFGVICGIGAVLALVAVLAAVPLLASTRWGLNLYSRKESDLPERLARFFEPVTTWIVDHPRSMTLFGIVLTALLSSSMYFLVPNNQATEALSTSSEAFAAVQQMDRRFGGTSTSQVLVEWAEPIRYDSAELLTAIDEAQQYIVAHPEVHNPTSLLNLVQAMPGENRTLAEKASWLRWVPDEMLRYYVRPDARRALIRLRMLDVGSHAQNRIFAEVQAGLDRLAEQHPGIRFQLTGTGVVAARNLNQMISDLAASLGSAAVIIFVVMAVGFRSLRLGLISIVPNLFPMAVTAAFLVLTGRPLQMTSVIVFSICLGVAVDDTIHFINRFQREMEYDGNVRASILRAYRAVGSAMMMTSLVLLVGFGSLQISEMPTTRLFSALSCLTVFAALVGDLAILPAMLRCFVRDRRQDAQDDSRGAPQHAEPQVA